MRLHEPEVAPAPPPAPRRTFLARPWKNVPPPSAESGVGRGGAGPCARGPEAATEEAPHGGDARG
eukprot:12955577-Alexandrium_andersonii.AAC.1